MPESESCHQAGHTPLWETNMTDRADQIIDALRSGHDRLATVVRGLSADDLTRRSGSSGWDVSQVLSHLGSGAEISLAALESSLAGGAAPDGDFNKGVWARWDAMSPAERAAGFLTADEALVTRFEGLDARTREELRIDLGFIPVPLDVATAARLKLSESTLHAWDVDVTFDPAATLAPDATEPLLDQVGMLLGFATRADALDGRPVAIAVHLTSPDRSFGLDVADAVALTDEPGRPDAVLSAPAEWWLRLVSGRHSPEHTPATVTLTGGKLTLDDLRGVFPGY
jgi:uncharacterized protein (TIGR03083 family)